MTCKNSERTPSQAKRRSFLPAAFLSLSTVTCFFGAGFSAGAGHVSPFQPQAASAQTMRDLDQGDPARREATKTVLESRIVMSKKISKRKQAALKKAVSELLEACPRILDVAEDDPTAAIGVVRLPTEWLGGPDTLYTAIFLTGSVGRDRVPFILRHITQQPVSPLFKGGRFALMGGREPAVMTADPVSRWMCEGPTGVSAYYRAHETEGMSSFSGPYVVPMTGRLANL